MLLDSSFYYPVVNVFEPVSRPALRRSCRGEIPPAIAASVRIEVLYFAVLRERLKRDAEPLELPAAATVGAARAALAEAHPELARLLPQVRSAVNRQMVGDEHTLCDGDELALIPPVAGGAARKIAVLPTPLSLDEVIACVQGAEQGG